MADLMNADVLVVGAGPAGSTVAAQLALAGWDVLLIDKAHFPREKTCGGGLTPRAIAALRTLGVLDQVTSQGHRVTGARLVSPSGYQLHVHFADHLDGLPPYGLVISRSRLDDLLLRHAIAQGARFLPDCKVTGPLSGDHRVMAGRRKGRPITFHARLIVLATGAQLSLLRSLGFMERVPPTVSAARAYWEDVEGPADAFEFYFDRRLRPGYAWLFPMNDGWANIGIGLFPRGEDRAGCAARLLPSFLEEHPALRERLSHARRATPIKGYPLCTDFPGHPVVREHVMLVGEACGLVNPVTGEGIDLAIESGLLAAEIADGALRRSGDRIAAAIRRYDRELHRRFAGFFREMRALLRLATGPRALDILIRQGGRHPELARTIVCICLGLMSPRAAFTPRTWRDILF
ncbi:MAG TPA: NAD(P)/FAD-dependent oxidoreductase [Caldilineae bacterium]|jgi:geranylgeranyl reductase family protein|nr:NAD(P)/FAD-dependent oxidoreductase [Caldilineae bacterium]